VNCLDAECHELLESGEVDMGVSFIKFRSGIDGGKLVASSPILIAVSERNPLARRDCMRPEDLVGNPLVYYMNGYESSFWLEKGGPRPSYSVNDILLAFDLVLNDKGVFPVPALSILDSMQGVAFVPFQGPNNRDDFYCSISEQGRRDARKLRACLALRDAMGRGGTGRAEPSSPRG